MYVGTLYLILNLFTKKLLSQQLPALFPDKLFCDPSAIGPREGVPHSPTLGVHGGAVAAQGEGLHTGGIIILSHVYQIIE